MDALKITNIEFVENYEDTSSDAVLIEINGKFKLLEWITGGMAERIDSHIKINELVTINAMMSGAHNPCDVISKIHDAIDAELQK